MPCVGSKALCFSNFKHFQLVRFICITTRNAKPVCVFQVLPKTGIVSVTFLSLNGLHMTLDNTRLYTESLCEVKGAVCAGQPFYFLQDATYQLVRSEKYSVITQIK